MVDPKNSVTAGENWGGGGNPERIVDEATNEARSLRVPASVGARRLALVRRNEAVVSVLLYCIRTKVSMEGNSRAPVLCPMWRRAAIGVVYCVR